MFNCDECCKDYHEEEPDTINGRGAYCSKCMDRMFQEEISLLNHQIMNFSKMHPIHQNQVIRDLNKKMEEDEFWKDDYLEEVKE